MRLCGLEFLWLLVWRGDAASDNRETTDAEETFEHEVQNMLWAWCRARTEEPDDKQPALMGGGGGDPMSLSVYAIGVIRPLTWRSASVAARDV